VRDESLISVRGKINLWISKQSSDDAGEDKPPVGEDQKFKQVSAGDASDPSQWLFLHDHK
jgi:hypothetical protein